MTLIKCSECGKEFSDKAAACPNCACPTLEIIKDVERMKNMNYELEQLRDIETFLIRIFNEYKFLDEWDIKHYFGVTVINNEDEENIFSRLMWLLNKNESYEYGNYFKRNAEIVSVYGYYTLKNIKDSYPGLTPKKIVEVINSITIDYNNDISLKKVRLIDVLINIAKGRKPTFVCDSNLGYEYYIRSSKLIGKLGEYFDGEYIFYIVGNYMEANRFVLISKDYDIIDNVKHNKEYKIGDIITFTDLLIFLSNGENIPSEIRFLDNKYSNNICTRNDNYNGDKDGISKIFNEYINLDQISFEDEIEIIKI